MTIKSWRERFDSDTHSTILISMQAEILELRAENERLKTELARKTVERDMAIKMAITSPEIEVKE